MRFSQSARKHKISKGRARQVMAAVDPVTSVRKDGTTEYSWQGVDDRGLHIAVVAIEKPDRTNGEPMILVIHVMPDYRQAKE